MTQSSGSPVSADSVWTDITQEFFDAIKSLELGELLHDSLFGLFEAMSAIEMMDPKMDAGMLCNRGSSTSLSFAQAVEKGVLKVDDIPNQDQIAIIDCTWACMISWLDGHSSAQTVFTNLYLQDPHTIVTRPLKAFCIAIYKIIDLVKQFVSKGLVYEEEDFRLSTYGYSLYPGVTEARATGMLREVEDELSRKKRKCEDPAEEAVVTALMMRISFTKLLLQAFIGLNRKDLTQAIVNESIKLLSGCSEFIPAITRTIDLGSPPVYVSDIYGSVTVGFDPTINQRLLPPTFPRYPPISSPVEAYKQLDELFARLKDVSKICSYTSFQSAIDLMIDVSFTKQCIISRSVAQCLYLPQSNRLGDVINCIDALKEDAKTFISPPALMTKSLNSLGNEASEILDRILKQCVKPFSSLIQLCGYNRARQRNRLAHLLSDFSTLLSESERADICLHNLFQKSSVPRSHLACFGTWVLYHTLRIMVMFLLTGFELDLYSVHEYHYIYWYLFDFLYSWLISTVTSAERFMNEQDNITSHNQTKSKRKNKVKPPKRRSFKKEVTMYRGYQNLCGGYFKTMVGFLKDGQIRLPHPEFDCEKVRYEHRFAPFNVLTTPRPVLYEDFKDVITSLNKTESEKLYLSACEHFHLARSLFGSIPNPDKEVTDLVLISKTNFIVTRLLATTDPSKRTTKPPHFDFGTHQHFPIIKLFS